MITEEGLVKVLDFGLAKLAETAQESDTGVTQPAEPRAGQGVITGTVADMPPEQAEGKNVDVRPDIFSFGVVRCERVTGRRPLVFT